MSKRVVTYVTIVLLAHPVRGVAAPEPKSVYKISPIVDGTIIGVTALGSVVPQALNSHLIHPSCPCDPNQVNGFDRPAIGNQSQSAATLSDITLGAALLVPPLLDYFDIGAGSVWAEDFVVYAEVLSMSGAFVTLSKYSVQRPVPLEYSGGLSRNDPNGYASFYSGHTSLTFAALSASAITANLRYRLGFWPWLIVGGVGASVAYERVAAGRHFPTDVMMGALAGTVTGALIPVFHHAHLEESLPVAVSWSDQSLALSWRHRF